jgi:fused signal recognition particle receptor
MSKLFGWFSKNKKAEKQKEQQAQEQAVAQTDIKADNIVDSADSVEEHIEPVQEVSVAPPGEATPDGNAAIHSSVVDSVNDRTGDVTEQPLDFSSDEKVDAEALDPLPQREPQASNALPTEVIEDAVDATSPTETVEQAEVAENNDIQQVAGFESEVEAEVIAEEAVAQRIDTDTDANAIANDVVAEPEKQEEASTPQEKKSLFSRLKESLSRTKANLGSGIVSLFKGKAIDDELYEDLETQLLVADVGMDTTQKIINHLTDSASRKDLKDAEALLDILKQQLSGMLDKVNAPLPEAMQSHNAQEGPFVILMVGVNGVGKTTTIGKLAKQFQQQGKKVMLAAGDTFRAAAVEQLQVWGERNNIPVIAQHTGSDSASVLYDALEAAKSRHCDVLIADTAGRLQNKSNLMEELKKVVRVMKKLNPNAPHEVMLTLDAGTGQNAVSQAKLFNEAVGLTGITLTKLDGTAKGGVIFSIADQFGIPIRYIGVGEGIDDLRQFDGQEFIDALFSEMDTPER